MQKFKQYTTAPGFTIVELLIVVVVIGILASITIVSYNGIITRAHQSKLVSEVGSAAMLMSVEHSSKGVYPVDRDSLNNGRGLDDDTDISFNFYSEQTTFCITAVSSFAGVDSYYVTNNNLSPTKGSCPQDLGAGVATLAGSGASGFANGTGAAAVLASPAGITSGQTGNLYFTDGASGRIRMVTTAGSVTHLSGAPGSGYVEGSATVAPLAQFHWPQAIAIGNGDLLYVADSNNNRVRSVTAAGATGLVAGSAAGDMPATTGTSTGAAALLRVPRGIIFGPTANRIYIADSENNKIRTSTAAGVLSTLAGQVSGGLVDGTGAAAKFSYPQGLAIDSAGTIYVADTRNHAIRKVTPAGVVSTIAGGGTTTTGQAGYVNANGKAARFDNPMGVAVDSTGNIYVADTNNNRIRKIASDGEVTTVAGNGTIGFKDGNGANTMFSKPQSLAIGSDGRLYVTDTGNHRIRVLTVY